MIPVRATMGLVDRLRGVCAPENITLDAKVIAERPTLNGDYEDGAEVSRVVVPVTFAKTHRGVGNTTSVNLPLLRGNWERVFIQLTDTEGEVYANGVIFSPNVFEGELTAETGALTIVGYA
ncbi:MAG: hypothetical protein VX561_10765 [Pseudomonadota bacterium]|nr:hypothetical protein [Pseudomonadota bacterium]